MRLAGKRGLYRVGRPGMSSLVRVVYEQGSTIDVDENYYIENGIIPPLEELDWNEDHING